MVKSELDSGLTHTLPKHLQRKRIDTKLFSIQKVEMKEVSAAGVPTCFTFH